MSVLNLPDWVPWWLPILVLIPCGLWALAMLVMPFSILGLKPRLDAIEARLDEVQEEIRSLVLRLPELPAERLSYSEPSYKSREAPMDQHYVQPPPPRPPIPPARGGNDFIPRRPDRMVAPAPPSGASANQDPSGDRPSPSPRTEPRLDWRR